MSSSEKTENLTHMQNNALLPLGWNPWFQAQLEMADKPELLPARVVGVRKNSFRVSDGKSEWLATMAGRLMHRGDCPYPVTGDWVLLGDTVIHQVLERRNALSRGAAGRRGKEDAQPNREQVIAANLDTVFIVCGLDRDYNPRRIERYMTLIYNCGLNPVVVLTKADLQPNPERFLSEVAKVAFAAPAHLVSALDPAGPESLDSYLAVGQTVCMVGSSGAGKSTLLNRLFGRSVAATGAVSDKLGKGRHTTTSRDLISMPQGGMVIDNPGIREIAFWDDDGGVGSVFPEIEELAGQCRFADCSHQREPGCRVLAAVSQGELSLARLESYRKMKRELDYLSQREHKSAERVEKERWKDIALQVKAIYKKKR